MRELGVRSLAVTCEPYHHEAVMLADRWPNAVPSARSVRAWSARDVESSAPTPGQMAGDAGKRKFALKGHRRATAFIIAAKPGR
jgi:hypothetical protein